MLRLFTIPLLSLFITATLSAEYVDKGCAKKGCTEYEWYNKGRFNPHTIHWPLHYTGEVYKDKRDGGHHEIHINHGYHASHGYMPLWNYRQQPECPDPWYLDEGVKMHDAFECDYWVEDKPTWKDSPCSEIFTSYEDKHVYVDGDACKKVIREWTIVDWCQYKPNTRANTYNEKFVLVHDPYKDKAYFTYGHGKHDLEYDGWYTFKQVIKIVDKHKPELVTDEDVTIELKDGKCEDYIKLRNKIVDGGPCAGEKIEVEATVKDEDGKVIIQKWINARHDKEFAANLGNLAAGHYSIHWKYKDGCGNANHNYQKLSIVDKNQPHLFCIKDISTSISDEHGTAIWAEDFAWKVSGSCNDKELSISFDLDEYTPSLKFDCDDELGIIDLTVFAIDGNDNSSSCNVELFVADHDACGEGMQIAGEVFNRNYEAMAGVKIDVVNGDDMLSSVMSDERGRYNLTGLPNQKSQTMLKPSMEDKTIDGLDANDLLYLLRHITRAERFENVLEYAAADMNSDGKIDLDDYWALADLVYNLSNQSEISSPWKFFDAKMYEGGQRRASKLVVPIPVKYFKHRYDIMGIKVGDVDFSLLDSGNKARSRSVSSIVAPYKEGISAGGKDFTFDLTTLDKASAVTITFDNASLADIASISTDDNEVKYFRHVQGGKAAVTIMSGTQLSGGVSITTSRNATLRSTSNGVVAEGQNLDGIDITWSNEIEVSTPTLSVSPNPFDDHIVIDYQSVTDEAGLLSMYGINGQRMLEQPIQVVKGANQIELHTMDLMTGIYLIKIETSQGAEVRRITKSRP